MVFDCAILIRFYSLLWTDSFPMDNQAQLRVNVTKRMIGRLQKGCKPNVSEYLNQGLTLEDVSDCLLEAVIAYKDAQRRYVAFIQERQNLMNNTTRCGWYLC